MKLFSIISLALGATATKLEWFDPSVFEEPTLEELANQPQELSETEMEKQKL